MIQALNVCSGIILARILDPAGRGELAAVILWPSIVAAVVSIGISQSSTYFAAVRPRDQRLTSTIGALALVQGAAGVLVGLVIVRGTPVLHQYGHAAVQSASLFVIYIPLSLTTLAFSGMLNGRGRYQAFQIVRVLVIATSVVGIASLAFAQLLTPRTATYTYVIAEFVTASVAVLLTLQQSGRPQMPSLSLARDISTFGAKAYVGSLSLLINLRFDHSVLSIVVSPVQYGYYVIATTLASLTNLIGVSLGLVSLPAIAREEDNATRVRLARRYLAMTVVLAALVTAPLVVILPTVIELAFGSSFLPAAGAARILLIGAVGYAAARVLEASLQGLGRPLDSSFGEGVAVVGTVIGVLALVPLLGIEGAALASLVAYSTAALFMWHRLAVFSRASSSG